MDDDRRGRYVERRESVLLLKAQESIIDVKQNYMSLKITTIIMLFSW